MVLRIGFVVNPMAGIGGPAGLKGSDEVAFEAADKGYEPTAQAKAERFLTRLKISAQPGSVRIFAAPGVLGGQVTAATGWKTGSLGAESFDDDPFSTDPEDTKRAARAAVELGMDLFVFVGGDGTARDVASAVGEKIAVLGVPAGVKMFSECFAQTPEAAADLVAHLAAPPFREGDELEAVEGDLLDLDEEAYREGRLQPRPHGRLRVPASPRVMAAKCPMVAGSDPSEATAGVVDRMESEPEALFVLGSGSTLMGLKEGLGLKGSLIGVDVVAKHEGGGWDLLAKDVDARTLEERVNAAREEGRRVVLVLAPIGGQGSVLGRGTGPIVPAVVEAALPEGVWVVATREKLASLRDGVLYVDTGDAALDGRFPSFLRVVTGPGRQKLMRVAGH